MDKIYNHEQNINIVSSPYDDTVVIVTNKAILTEMMNAIADGSRYQEEHGYNATAELQRDLFTTLYNKKNAMKGAK